MDQQIFGDFHVRGRLKGIGNTAKEILELLKGDGGKNILTTINSNTETIQKLTKCIHTDVDHKMDELYYAVSSLTSGSSNTTENSYKVIPITIAVDGNQNSTPDLVETGEVDASTDYDKYFTNKYVVKVNYHGIEVIGDAYTTKDGTESLITTPYIPNCLLIDGKLYDKSYKMLTPTYTPIEEDITKSIPIKITVNKTDGHITSVRVEKEENTTEYVYDLDNESLRMTIGTASPVVYPRCDISNDENILVIKAGPLDDDLRELFKCDLSNYYSSTPDGGNEITYRLIGRLVVIEDATGTITQVKLIIESGTILYTIDDDELNTITVTYNDEPIGSYYYGHIEYTKNGNSILITHDSGEVVCIYSLANPPTTKDTEYKKAMNILTVTQGSDYTKVIFNDNDTSTTKTFHISLSNVLSVFGDYSYQTNGEYQHGSIVYTDSSISITADDFETIIFDITKDYQKTEITTTYDAKTTKELYRFNFQCPSGCSSIYMLPNFFDPDPTKNVFPNIGNTLRQSPAINDISYVSLSSSEDPDDTNDPSECTHLYTYNKSTKVPPRLLPWDNKYENMTVNITLSSATLVYDSETYYPLFMCDLGEKQDDTIYLIKHGTPHLKTYEKQEKPTIDDKHGGGQEHEELLEANK